MNADYKHSEITGKIIGAAYRVHNTLGHGFLERVYENALALELREAGLQVEQQFAVPVRYRGEPVGDYVADLVVEAKVVVEVKAASALEKVHEAQLINYLKATGMEVGLLLNFAPEMEIKRRIFSQRESA